MSLLYCTVGKEKIWAYYLVGKEKTWALLGKSITWEKEKHKANLDLDLADVR